ncbi:hypothetical protein ES288_A07G083500v1 [Gossypium darwinii]|uniref:Uncharacterized protein n=1 Tax=Gossypium darwinii TaxID=34276 RepID=A0A5D2FTE0_GOSDA|nr:hypothetical protein ES288_A07G083500v1 [Gossypium darwinii]
MAIITQAPNFKKNRKCGDGLLSLVLRHIRRPCLLNPQEIERKVPPLPDSTLAIGEEISSDESVGRSRRWNGSRWWCCHGSWWQRLGAALGMERFIETMGPSII